MTINGLQLVHRTAAIVHAAGGLSATSGGRGAAVAMGGERRQLLLQLRGVALGALGLFPAKNNGFKFVAALGANVFENRHVHSWLYPLQRRHSAAIMVVGQYT